MWNPNILSEKLLLIAARPWEQQNEKLAKIADKLCRFAPSTVVIRLKDTPLEAPQSQGVSLIWDKQKSEIFAEKFQETCFW